MTEPTVVRIVALLPNHEALARHADGKEEKVSLEMCGCASLGDTVFLCNGLVLCKLRDQKLPDQKNVHS
ncbi:MAG: hypothetical protein PHH40_04150 [Candidatus Moranbacteria bacterium]|nr:hypothetical protein [Candidatus Moranbacteria bacterium]MDD3964570.1 hypothetical protein [Candidatus Moranbacteria bacterium]